MENDSAPRCQRVTLERNTPLYTDLYQNDRHFYVTFTHNLCTMSYLTVGTAWTYKCAQKAVQQCKSEVLSIKLAMTRSIIALALFLVAAQAKVQLSFFGDQLTPKVLTSAASDSSEWVAQAEYSPASEHVSNFGQYKVKTNALFSDNAQTFAAGYLEGYLTAETIHQHYANMMCQVDCSGAVPPELKEFFIQQDLWTRQQVQKNPDSPYWNYIGKV